MNTNKSFLCAVSRVSFDAGVGVGVPGIGGLPGIGGCRGLGWGVLNIVLYRNAPHRPLPLKYVLLTKRYPFHLPSRENGTPFILLHMPIVKHCISETPGVRSFSVLVKFPPFYILLAWKGTPVILSGGVYIPVYSIIQETSTDFHVTLIFIVSGKLRYINVLSFSFSLSLEGLPPGFDVPTTLIS